MTNSVFKICHLSIKLLQDGICMNILYEISIDWAGLSTWLQIFDKSCKQIQSLYKKMLKELPTMMDTVRL